MLLNKSRRAACHMGGGLGNGCAGRHESDALIYELAANRRMPIGDKATVTKLDFNSSYLGVKVQQWF